MIRFMYFLLVFGTALSTARAEAPPDALRDFEAWKKSGDYATGNRLRTVLKEKGPKGEALAAHILEAVRNEKFRPDAMRLLSARAFTIDDKDQSIKPHIDGPYLRILARMSVPDDANQLYFRGYHAAVAYLKLHPEDHEIYWRLRLAATRDAKVEALPKWDGKRLLEPEKIKRPSPLPLRHYGLNDAWEILLKLKVLKPNMPVEDAVRILGNPESRTENSIRWYHRTPRHVNPMLLGELTDGKIIRFRNSKG